MKQKRQCEQAYLAAMKMVVVGLSIGRLYLTFYQIWWSALFNCRRIFVGLIELSGFGLFLPPKVGLTYPTPKLKME